MFYSVIQGVSKYMGPMRLLNTKSNIVFFLVQIWKYFTITSINPPSQCLGQEGNNIFCHYLFEDNIIQNWFEIDATN